LLSQVENYNFALSRVAADSVFCKIVQADDWIFPECLERMIQVALPDPTIGLVAAFYLQGNRVAGWGAPVGRSRYSGRDVGRYHLLGGNFLFGSPSTVMYRAELVRGQTPFYATDRYHEDTDAAYDMIERSNFGFVHQVLSFIRTENDSIMKSRAGFNPWILDKYISLHRHGRRFLTEDEFAARVKVVEKEYFGFLGNAFVRRRSPEFWRYHEEGLKSVGLSIPTARIWLYAANSAISLLLNPRATVERFIKALNQALGPPRPPLKDPLSALDVPAVAQQREELR
jgi:hypothetical protein